MMTIIQAKIADYLRGTSAPSQFCMRCFVGMLETGEATLDDFRVVGGDDLVSQVKFFAEMIKCK